MEIYRKLEGLLTKSEMSQVKAVVVIPLENACSSCAISTLKQLSLLEAKYRGEVELVFTAKTYKLIDQVMEEMDLSG